MEHCSGSQKGNTLFTLIETHFRGKDLFEYVSCYMTNMMRFVKKQTNKKTTKPQVAEIEMTGVGMRPVLLSGLSKL